MTIRPPRRVKNETLKASPKPLARPAYIAEKLESGEFFYGGNVEINGDVLIEDRLVVGGNLIVGGKLKAAKIFCGGLILVKGDAEIGDAYVGVSIESGGRIDGAYIDVGLPHDSIENLILSEIQNNFPLGWDAGNESLTEEFIFFEILKDIESNKDICSEVVRASGDFDSYVLKAKGEVNIGGALDVDSGETGGIKAQKIVLREELDAFGTVECTGDISGGELFATELICLGNLDVSSISTDESIKVLGYISVGEITAGEDIQAGRWIASSGKIRSGAYIKSGESVIADVGIHTGADHGVCAGLAFPRSQWIENGYVSSPKKPRNILTGHFVPRRAA